MCWTPAVSWQLFRWPMLVLGVVHGHLNKIAVHHRQILQPWGVCVCVCVWGGGGERVKLNLKPPQLLLQWMLYAVIFLSWFDLLKLYGISASSEGSHLIGYSVFKSFIMAGSWKLAHLSTNRLTGQIDWTAMSSAQPYIHSQYSQGTYAPIYM